MRWLRRRRTAALEDERDDQARDALVIALGELRDRRAIPALAALIRSPDTDGDTRFTAAQSLGRLVRRRFDKAEDPWLLRSVGSTSTAASSLRSGTIGGGDR